MPKNRWICVIAVAAGAAQDAPQMSLAGWSCSARVQRQKPWKDNVPIRIQKSGRGTEAAHIVSLACTPISDTHSAGEGGCREEAALVLGFCDVPPRGNAISPVAARETASGGPWSDRPQADFR